MLPSVASLSTYGGALNDYSPPIDASTDRPAAGANPAYGDTAAMTHTAIRGWARFTPAGSSTPTLASHDETWNNGNNSAPTIARSEEGIYTLTYPATVYDEIPATSPGGVSGGYALNLRAGFCNEEIGGSTLYKAIAFITSPNVVTVKIFSVGSSPALTDPNDGTVIGVFVT